MRDLRLAFLELAKLSTHSLTWKQFLAGDLVQAWLGAAGTAHGLPLGREED
jgi:hypothetical protein